MRNNVVQFKLPVVRRAEMEIMYEDACRHVDICLDYAERTGQIRHCDDAKDLIKVYKRIMEWDDGASIKQS